MRLTMHNARGAKNSSKGYSPRHNDRRYDLSKADNIDINKTATNLYFTRKQGWNVAKKNIGKPFESFEDFEREFYQEHFYAMYQEQQDRHKARRQYKRMTDFETWRTEKRYCPEETVLQVGNVDDHISAREMQRIAVDYLKMLDKWSADRGGCYTILDAALHFDEAVPHLHVRKVWHHGGVIGQNEAFRQIGMDPDGGKAKKDYTREIRQAAIAICKGYEIEIEEVPQDGVEHNRSKEKLIADKVRENRSVEQQNLQLLEEKESLQAEVTELQKEKTKLQDMPEAELLAELQRRRLRNQQRVDSAAAQADMLVNPRLTPGRKTGKNNIRDRGYADYGI